MTPLFTMEGKRVSTTRSNLSHPCLRAFDFIVLFKQNVVHL